MIGCNVSEKPDMVERNQQDIADKAIGKCGIAANSANRNHSYLRRGKIGYWRLIRETVILSLDV